jgi:hypothetical protein
MEESNQGSAYPTWIVESQKKKVEEEGGLVPLLHVCRPVCKAAPLCVVCAVLYLAGGSKFSAFSWWMNL